MKYKNLSLKLFITVGILFTNTLVIAQQKVSYKLLEDRPYTNKLDIGIAPIDFMLMGDNIMGGPKVSVLLRPTKRVTFNGALGIAPILTPDSLTGIKKSGGLFIDAGASYVWNRIGKNLTKEKGDTVALKGDIRLKTESSGYNRSTVTSLSIPLNRMVERAIRGGGFYYNFPTVEDASQSAGGYVGISKSITKAASISTTDYGERSVYDQIGYHFDILFGSTNFHSENGDGTTTSRGGAGFRFGMDFLHAGGLFPIGVSMEAGTLPGIRGFWKVTFSGNILKGKHFYNGKYKYKMRRKKFIPIVAQFLI